MMLRLRNSLHLLHHAHCPTRHAWPRVTTCHAMRAVVATAPLSSTRPHHQRQPTPLRPTRAFPPAGWSDWQGGCPRFVYRIGHQWRHPALGGHEGQQDHRGNQHRPRRTHLPGEVCWPRSSAPLLVLLPAETYLGFCLLGHALWMVSFVSNGAAALEVMHALPHRFSKSCRVGGL